MGELVCHHADEFIVIEVLNCKGTDNEDVTATGEGVDVGTVVDREDESAVRLPGRGGDYSNRCIEARRFVGSRGANSEQAGDEQALGDRKEHHHRTEGSNRHERGVTRVEHDVSSEETERSGHEPCGKNGEYRNDRGQSRRVDAAHSSSRHPSERRQHRAYTVRMAESPVMEGAESWSHVGTLDAGVVVVHGFTGNPGSMRGLAEACAAAGFHVEMPRLAGHGTHVDDMVPTRWSDWSRDADAAYATLAKRVSKVVVMGLSMGGTLTLWLAAQHPETAGIVCVNPATFPFAGEMVDAVRGILESGTEIIPGIGSDIADPDVTENAYPGTPIRPLISFVEEGLAPLSSRYGSIDVPLLLFTSVNDHVVEPSQSDLLADAYHGPVERVMLERSFHVATQDFDKGIIFEGAVAFARRVTGI